MRSIKLVDIIIFRVLIGRIPALCHVLTFEKFLGFTVCLAILGNYRDIGKLWDWNLACSRSRRAACTILYDDGAAPHISERNLVLSPKKLEASRKSSPLRKGNQAKSGKDSCLLMIKKN
jgi:hypothetical protein